MPTLKKRCGLPPFLIICLVLILVGVLIGACGDDGGQGDPSLTVTPTAASDSTTPETASPSTTLAATVTSQASAGTATTSGSTTSIGATPTAPASTTSSAPMTTAGATTTLAPTTTAALPATTTTTPASTTTTPTTTMAKGPVVLTVKGPSGVAELSMADLKALPATSGYGGWKNQLSNITGPVSWRGVSLRALMKLVGGGSSVTVVASDGYTQSLSAGQIAGAVTTYDPTSGAAVEGVSVTAIVAYAKAGSALGSGEGPLRIAFVSAEQNQVTDSEMWAKYVVEIRVD